jgi:hypothetical protein
MSSVVASTNSFVFCSAILACCSGLTLPTFSGFLIALAIDTIRGLIYRDFKKHHPAQDLADKMIQVKDGPNGQKTATCRYDLIIDNAKPQYPLSDDIKDEVRDLNEIGDIHFEPDFDPFDLNILFIMYCSIIAPFNVR